MSNVNAAADMAKRFTDISKIIRVASGGVITRLPTGGTKFASGGTSAITGDAAGSNIFANGAKPELVQADGNMTVTPLNKSGTERKERISRLTANERRSALATSLASHIIKVGYTLPNGTSDVSNIGEAIKVYNVKPGISDPIDIGNGQTTSLIGLLAAIYNQLIAIGNASSTEATLLKEVAVNTRATASKISATNAGNPFTSGTFPTALNGILEGE